MHDAVAAIAQGLGIERTFDLNWLGRERNDPVAGVLDKLRTIRSSTLVITDTYHCAVNAWREGTPAICIGRGVETPRSTLADKKKELLFFMFNMKDFYVFSESLGPKKYDRVVEVFKRVLADDVRTSAIGRNIALSSDRARTRLKKALLD
jgi:hypothetical protein